MPTKDLGGSAFKNLVPTYAYPMPNWLYGIRALRTCLASLPSLKQYQSWGLPKFMCAIGYSTAQQYVHNTGGYAQ